MINDKLINHVAFVADSFNPDDSVTKFIEQILMDMTQNDQLLKGSENVKLCVQSS